MTFPRQHGRLDSGGGEFGCVCPLTAAVTRLAGVHFSSCFSAGMVVSTVMARNLPPLPAVRSRCAPSRRAFLQRFPAGMVVSTVMAEILPPCARLRLAGVLKRGCR
ncbi:MAG: hypothetical protein ACLR23_21320 [Clostridia bacterium]